MGLHEKWNPNEKTPGHPTGTMWCPHGTIRVYAFKAPMENQQGKKVWELVLRTDRPLVADRVEAVWKKNGFQTRREE